MTNPSAKAPGRASLPLSDGHGVMYPHGYAHRERIRAFREAKKLTQTDIEKRTGILKVYTSRIENNHTVPSLPTLEKYARALEVPLYQLFYEDDEPPKLPRLPKGKAGDGSSWGSSGKGARILGQFYRLMSRMDQRNRKLLLLMARKLSRPVTARRKPRQ